MTKYIKNRLALDLGKAGMVIISKIITLPLSLYVNKAVCLTIGPLLFSPSVGRMFILTRATLLLSPLVGKFSWGTLAIFVGM